MKDYIGRNVNKMEECYTHAEDNNNIMNEEYKMFVNSLMKPSATLNEEITANEEKMMNCVLSLSSQADSLLYVIKDTLLDTYGEIIGRPNCLALKHMALGFVGECGELIDTVKRIAIYRKGIFNIKEDNKSYYDNLIEEIGDTGFYPTGIMCIIDEILKIKELTQDEKDDIDQIKIESGLFISSIQEFIQSINNYLIGINCSAYQFTIEYCVELNQEKLRIRYEKGSYSDKQATERKDKNASA